MAKQTFTVGQVLTAAQMTSLQQTAMGGGSTTAKTASYTLVAADAGTVVQMNSASATTITVNTALFAAGDAVQIQNIGSGVCTVTAGTATVSTSSTLALKQYDAGTLYFNTTSAALFFAVDAADGSSPLTTKGDLYGFSTLDARIPIGTNNQVLTADSAQALGLKWATLAATTFNGVQAFKQTSNQTITTATNTLVTWNGENFDTDAYHDNTTNNSRLTVPAGLAGKYWVYANFISYGDVTTALVRLYKNGVSVQQQAKRIVGSSEDNGVQINFTIDLAVADYMEVYYYQAGGTNGTINGSAGAVYSSFGMYRVGV